MKPAMRLTPPARTRRCVLPTTPGSSTLPASPSSRPSAPCGGRWRLDDDLGCIHSPVPVGPSHWPGSASVLSAGCRSSAWKNVPPHGPVILACNHLAFTDPPLLVAAIPRPLHFLGKRELFANPIGNLLMRGFHVIPYDRETASTYTMRTLLGLLDRGPGSCHFP